MKMLRRIEIPKTESTFNLHIQNDHNYIIEGGLVAANCHKAKSESIKGILEKLPNCQYRIGLTGTLDGMQCNKLIVEGLTGPAFRAAYTKSLQDANLISDCKIKCLVLQYNKEYTKHIQNANYQAEIDLLIGLPQRNKFIVNLTKGLKGNTLVLFRYVEKHGIPLYEAIKKACPDKDVFLVYGDVSSEDRERIRRFAEKNTNCTIVASYQTFSTGINIPSLQNLILASPVKAKVTVIQSIGRILRKYNGKIIATIFDISDDLSYKSNKNYGIAHAEERMKHYRQEKMDFETMTIPINIG